MCGFFYQWLLLLGSSLVSCNSKKQVYMNHSPSEAEYKALATTTCELQWLSCLLHDLHITCSRPVILYCDNQSALHIAANPVFHKYLKHLDINCHIIHERTLVVLMKLLPVSLTKQVAPCCLDFSCKISLS